MERYETMLIIKCASFEHEGYYQCMATNEVSTNVTRAKFQLSSSTAGEERVFVEPKIQKVRKPRKIIRRKLEQPPVYKQVISVLPAPAQVIVEIAKETATETKAKTTTTTAATASSSSSATSKTSVKVVEQTTTTVTTSEEHHHHLEVHEEIEEIRVKIQKELVSEKDIQTFKYANEVNEILELIEAHKFGDGQLPLRELATIGYLVQRGITVTEITLLYNADTFPALRNPEAQAALVQLVERQGHGTLISEVLTEETTVDDEHVFASTVGFRAFMRMIEREHIAIEEVITHFREEDFVHHEWKHAEARETIVSTQTISETGNCNLSSSVSQHALVIERMARTTKFIFELLHIFLA